MGCIKEAQRDAVQKTAESILKIINFLLFRVPDKNKEKYLKRIRDKIIKLPVSQISQKKMPPTASIGQSISLTKQILAGFNPIFVKQVINAIGYNMHRLYIKQSPLPIAHVSSYNFPLSKRAMDVVIMPMDAQVQSAVQKIKQVYPGILSRVSKIVVHPETHSHLGHVESGPDKDPREIHLFKGTIDQQLKKRIGNAKPTPKEYEEMLIEAIIEVIGHEAGHIGEHERSSEQIISAPFFGEGEAEIKSKEVLRRVFPQKQLNNDIPISVRAHYVPLQSPWDYDIVAENENQLPWSGNVGDFLKQFPKGISEWKKWRNEKLMNHFVTKDHVRVNPNRIVDIIPAPLKKDASLKEEEKDILKIIGVLFDLINYNPIEDKFTSSLIKWQNKNKLDSTGLLNLETVKYIQDNLPNFNNFPKNFGIVSLKPIICRGALPDFNQIKLLRDSMGIKRIVSLDVRFPEIKEWCNTLNIEHIFIDLVHGANKESGWDKMGNISNFLNECPTFIHCLHGRDRTGGVISRYRTENYWPCELAYLEAKAYGFRDIFIDMIDRMVESCKSNCKHRHPPVYTNWIRDVIKAQLPIEQDSFDLMNIQNEGAGSISNNPSGIRTIPISLPCSDILVGTVGLRDSGTEENMNQGFFL